MLRKMIASVLASAAVLAASGAGPLKIRGTAFANWWRTGETVCFKGNQPIPENKEPAYYQNQPISDNKAASSRGLLERQSDLQGQR